MSDFHALSGACAVDALDDVERARFERHLAECAECRAEVASLQEAAVLLAETSAATPPPALRERVLAEIATVRPLPPAVAPPEAPEALEAPAGATAGASPAARRAAPLGARGRRRWTAGLVAAAAVVAATGVGGVVWEAMRDDPPGISQPADPVDQVLQAGDAERYTQRFADGSRATIVRSRELNRAVVLTQDMAPPPPGKTYELWLDHADVGMVPAGTMDAGEDTLLLEGDPATAIGAGITVEPDGGSPTPSDEVVHVFTFDQA